MPSCETYPPPATVRHTSAFSEPFGLVPDGVERLELFTWVFWYPDGVEFRVPCGVTQEFADKGPVLVRMSEEVGDPFWLDLSHELDGFLGLHPHCQFEKVGSLLRGPRAHVLDVTPRIRFRLLPLVRDDEVLGDVNGHLDVGLRLQVETDGWLETYSVPSCHQKPPFWLNSQNAWVQRSSTGWRAAEGERYRRSLGHHHRFFLRFRL